VTPTVERDAVLVLGAAGFIGSRLVHTLASRGTRVLAATRTPFTRTPPGVQNTVDEFISSDSFSSLLGSCKAVIHAAAHSTPGSSMATPLLDGDLRTTLSLLEALQANTHCRLLFLSSAGTLYGDRHRPAREFDPLRPRSYHGAGKAAAEHFIQAWTSQYCGTAIIIRASNVYGAGQTSRAGFAIVPTAMQCALDGSELQIYGTGTEVRDYLHIDDLVDLCLAAVDWNCPAGTHIFNAASGNATPLDELLATIETVSGRKILRRFVSARPADIHSILIDPGAAREAFGWQATIPLAKGLMDTWHWFNPES
jgi:UDP-glucose 4-epimerase